MSSKRLSPQDKITLGLLKERLLLTVGFVENLRDFPMGGYIRSAIEKAVNESSIRSMKLISRELDKMTAGMPSFERDGLDALLKQRLGVDKDAERAQVSEQIAKVIRRGIVNSEKERKRLEEYVEMLEASGGQADEIKAVKRLLAEG